MTWLNKANLVITLNYYKINLKKVLRSAEQISSNLMKKIIYKIIIQSMKYFKLIMKIL